MTGHTLRLPSVDVLVVVVLVGLLVAAPNLSKHQQVQALLDVPCPSRAASGRIEAGQVQVIFHSPQSQRDIPIDYDGNNWSSEKTQQQLVRLTKQGFNASNPTSIYLHAYIQSAGADWLQEVRREYDTSYSGQFNLMLFDWSYFSRQRYDSSVSWAPKLGQVLGEFLLRLQAATAASDDGSSGSGGGSASMMGRVHLVSYSLSTHIAGLASRHIKQQGGGGGESVGRITALDPTGVCFHNPKSSRFASQFALRPSDARLVVARHYDMGTLGAGRPIGGIDVFVNGGKNQPTPARGSGRYAFWSVARSVGFRAPSHMMASLNEVQESPGDCRPVAYGCASYAAFLSGECADCGTRRSPRCMDLNSMDATVDMRLDALKAPQTSRSSPSGTSMFIKTTQESACIYHYQAVLRLKSELSRAQRRLLEDSVSFAFITADKGQRVQRAKVSHQPEGESRLYTALLTTENGRLADSNRIQMQLYSSSSSSSNNNNNNNNNNRRQDRQLAELAESIDSLELNYMSHDQASVRDRKSAKFCVNSQPESNNDVILRKCR